MSTVTMPNDGAANGAFAHGAQVGEAKPKTLSTTVPSSFCPRKYIGCPSSATMPPLRRVTGNDHVSVHIISDGISTGYCAHARAAVPTSAYVPQAPAVERVPTIIE